MERPIPKSSIFWPPMVRVFPMASPEAAAALIAEAGAEDFIRDRGCYCLSHENFSVFKSV